MRIMAFDYGTKRIGIAVTDPLKLIATALDTIHPNAIIQYLKDYLTREQVEAFVVGMPKQMDGSDSQSAMHIRGFIRLLKKTFPSIQIHTIDERFTSKIASATIAQSGLKRSKRQEKSLVDSVSAVIILQSFMESSLFK
ncbi:Holliday junction resolvase RuvX [Olivibacter sp. SDN3]|uniref:Holliday junction resolvase RuvX n=1 Tax=Olivibacter sp. SDN3 TaxID=2764720 RepID=UPI001651AC35|nr:Holliday junction resolvase RuvX [Olivibacter sp. SDN3]QNL50713.1 Holliday junction resolvase RuvX [Olivibacter sp. SDN3]